MADKTLLVKIATPAWIAEIHQQGPIVTPIEIPSKIVLSMVRKGHKVTAVNKFTREEVKLTVLNALDPFKEGNKAKDKKVEKAAKVEAPINPNIGAPVMETVQPKVEAPVVEEVAPVEAAPVVEETVEVTEEPVAEVVAEVVEEVKVEANHKNKNKNNFRK